MPNVYLFTVCADDMKRPRDKIGERFLYMRSLVSNEIALLRHLVASTDTESENERATRNQWSDELAFYESYITWLEDTA